MTPLSVNEFTVEVEQIDGYEFRTRFDKAHYPDLITDEPAPLGRDSAPSPIRLLAAAVGNCISASLLFCARKSGAKVGHIKAVVKTTVVRNEHGRLRVAKIEADLDPNMTGEERARASQCFDVFRDFCVVTESVRSGIDVSVRVRTPGVAEPDLALQ